MAMENYHLVTDDLTGDEPSASMDHSGISQPAMELMTLEGNPQLIILYILIQWIGKRENLREKPYRYSMGKSMENPDIRMFTVKIFPETNPLLHQFTNHGFSQVPSRLISPLSARCCTVPRSMCSISMQMYPEPWKYHPYKFRKK